MNQPGLEALEAEIARMSSIVRQQEQLLRSLDDEIALDEEILRQEIRKRNALLALVCPPVRPDRDLQKIKASIEDLKAESARLEQAIARQETKLQGSESGSLSHIEDGDISQPSLHEKVPLNELKSQLADCHTRLQKWHALLSPISTLPVEILGDIFNKCKESEFYSKSPYPNLLSITHVCSLWRSLAINKSHLWTSISVTIDDDRSKQGWTSLIELWMNRSKKFPLNFCIIQERDKRGHPPSAKSGCFLILDLFISQSQRWKSAEMLYPRYALPSLGLREKLSSITSFPLLESISMRCHTMADSDLLKLMDMLDRSPRLHSVHWNAKPKDVAFSFPWAQLTHLTLVELLNIEQGLEILSAGHNIVCAEISVHVVSGELQGVHDHIQHENLKHLNLGASGNLDVLLNLLTMPNLTHLELDEIPSPSAEGQGMNTSWNPADLLSFLRRSKCKLQELLLREVRLSSEDLLSLLWYTSPTLTGLYIHPNPGSQCVTDEVLKAVSYPTGNVSGDDELDPTTILCSRLSHLHLGGSIDTTDGLLSEMVKSRMFNIPSNLQKLELGEFGMHVKNNRPKDLESLQSLSAHHDNIDVIIMPDILAR